MVNSNSLLNYQALLVKNPDVKRAICNVLSPATLLPVTHKDKNLCITCLTVHCKILTVLFSDGSSFLHEWKWRAGYVVVTETEVLEAKPLPVDTSAQEAELV